MKKFIFIMIAVFLAFTVNAQNIMLRTSNSGIRKSNDQFTGFHATFSYDKIESVTISNTERGTFSALTIAGAYPDGELGTPQLPVFKKMISIPVDATPRIIVKNFTSTEYNLEEYGINKIFPAQPDVRKKQDQSKIPFYYEEKVYNSNDYNNSSMADVEILGQMRGVILGMVTIHPIQYNPGSNSIMVYNDIDIEVVFDNANYKKTEELLVNTFSPYFLKTYDVIFNNGVTRDLYDDHPDLYKTPVRMLVIANRMFETTLQPWIEWKRLKGFIVDVNYTDVIGTTAAQIKTFCHNKYNQGVGNSTAPTFIVFVGDTPQVPASGFGIACTGSYEWDHHKSTDLYYATVDGDYFPEMYYSRMSAQTTQQLENIVEKILYYEKYQFADPSYLDNVLLIAGWDSNWNPTVGVPTINYATNYYFNAAHGYTNIFKYLDTYFDCYTNLNNVGFANYTAHCNQSRWSDPEFNITQICSLTNLNKYFVAMGNCCLAADFGYEECFGEAMIRAQKKGAVGYIGSSPASYWANDLHFAVGAYSGTINYYIPTNPTVANTTTGCYDFMFHDADFNTLCSHVFGGNLAVTYAHTHGYNVSNPSPLYYWEAYNVLGDGSLMPYNGQASVNPVSHLSTMLIGMNTFQVFAVPGSYVAISKAGVLHGVAVANASGEALVTLNPPISSNGNLDIVVTRNQYKPYIAKIPAIVSECYDPNSGVPIIAGTITQNTTLISPVYTSGITVQSGVTLTAKSTVFCDKNADITINSGGKLIVDGGTITNACPNQLWKGIIVIGDPNPSYPNYQSTVRVINNGKIENAKCAITVNAFATVDADNARFENNTIGIYFKLDAGGGTFKRTIFDLNDNYLGDSGYGCYGDKRDFITHLRMYSSGSITIEGCDFISSAPYPQSYNSGIEAFDTDLTIKEYCPFGCPLNSYCQGCPILCSDKCSKKSSFLGFKLAISGRNFGALPKLKIRYTTFKNNYVGAVYNQANLLELLRNEFYLSQLDAYGLNVEYSTGYKIEENLYKDNNPALGKNTVGTLISNSGTPENEIYNNRYYGLDIAQQFLGTNSSQKDTLCGGYSRGISPGVVVQPYQVSGLQTLCNEFDNNKSRDVLLGNINSSCNMNSIRSVQGSLQAPAGNEFILPPPPFNIDNTLSQHNLTYYYDVNALYSFPNNVTSNVTRSQTIFSNGCHSKAFTGGGGHQTKEGGEWNLDKALSQYDEWNSMYEYWVVKLIAYEGKEEDEEYKMLLDMVSYYSALKDNYFNSIVFAAISENDKTEWGDWKDLETNEMLRFLFNYRNHYTDHLYIVETYIAENNYRMAMATINNMYKQFELSEYGKLELEGLQTFVLWKQQLYESGSNIYELNDTEINKLVKYVESHIGRGVVFANNILCAIYHICIDNDKKLQYVPPKHQIEEEPFGGNVEKNSLQISDKELLNRIIIIPNPTTGVLTVNSGQLSIINIDICDIYGRILSSNHLIISSSNHQIDISHLQPGIYFIKINTKQGEVVKKTIKQ